MMEFMQMLFKEADDTILMKQSILNKFNEANVPITWARLVSTNCIFEKKTVFPPWSLTTKIAIVLPLKSPEENLSVLEQSIIEILIDKINQTKEKFTLPVRLAEMQKEIQLRLDIRSPPLFIILKQLNNMSLDHLFYHVLEDRGIIREGVLNYLKEKYPAEEWSLKLMTGLLNDELHLFMQYSHEI